MPQKTEAVSKQAMRLVAGAVEARSSPVKTTISCLVESNLLRGKVRKGRCCWEGGERTKKDRIWEKLYLHAALETALMCSVMYGEEGMAYFLYFSDELPVPCIKGRSPVLLWTHWTLNKQPCGKLLHILHTYSMCSNSRFRRLSFQKRGHEAKVLSGNKTQINVLLKRQ